MNDGLYPEIEPYKTAMLPCEGHQLYYELSGNPEGPTALFLHGGPGGVDTKEAAAVAGGAPFTRATLQRGV